MQVKLVRKFEGLRFPRPSHLRPSAGAPCPCFNYLSCYPRSLGEAVLKIPYRNVFLILSHDIGFREERDPNLPSFWVWQVNQPIHKEKTLS
jgi:hypothetical protein